jgi:hypothetical protein
MTSDPDGILPRGCDPTLLDDVEYKVAYILHEWNGLWECYERLMAELRGQFKLDLKRRELRKILQTLVAAKVITYGTAWSDDGMLRGSGYFHVDGDGW